MKKESLQEQRKNRIGRNDFRRNMRAKRDNERGSLVLLGAAVLFLFSATLSGQSEELHAEALVWKKECQRYFFFKDPRIVYYIYRYEKISKNRSTILPINFRIIRVRKRKHWISYILIRGIIFSVRG